MEKKHYLLMKYHPAKKEVDFQHFQNDKKVEIGSGLQKYVNRKGEFVLQDFGDSFFESIAKEFSGLNYIDLRVITTKLDYEDFVQMVEHYNKVGNIRITTELIAELPDMEKTFAAVKKHGEKAIGILESHRQDLFAQGMNKEAVRNSAEEFAKKIAIEIEAIKSKINSLNDNKVSLCFTGVYSAGKSALINAILGYRILPEDIESKTAKMFRIVGLKKGENPQIEMDIDDVYTRIDWNERNKRLELTVYPPENESCAKIQQTINGLAKEGKECFEQIKGALDIINEFENITSTITIHFNIPLDTERVQFTIYDTPGTDSNYVEHQIILEEALSQQTQSILIFVAKPDGLEGEGNNALLGYLKRADEKDSKTTIDIGRSIFVINKADGQSAQNRETLQEQEIKRKNDPTFRPIKLADKKLLFTSARYAYAAKAMKNKIANAEDQGFYEGGKAIIMMDVVPTSFCYRQNKYATSEIATARQIKLSDDAYNEALKKGNEEDAMVIASGLFALENELVTYGEKYASAVKAFAIIDSVDKALTKLNNQAFSLSESNQKDINEINENIKALKATIIDAINTGYKAYEVKKDNEDKPIISEEVLKKLHLSADSIRGEITKPTLDYIDSTIKGWFLGYGKVKVKEGDKKKVREKVNEVVKKFSTRFLEARVKELENQRDTFMKLVKDAVSKDGKISDAAKQFIQSIEAPTIKTPKEIKATDDIYDENKRTGNLFFKEILDKDGFVNDVEDSLSEMARKMFDDYKTDYMNAMNNMLNGVKSQFLTNLETYSLDMKAMIEDRDDMIRLGNIIADAANVLTQSQNELNEIIWQEVES